jgi:UDP-N-acetylmuramoyl-L-alanyl-D-glutamate--2,6-diaminopimelate ligase
MLMDEILRGVETLENSRSTADVTGVQYDSRKVLRGDVFVAMRGGTTDGNQYIATAIERGASAILTDSPEVWDKRGACPGVPFYLVSNGRRALAEAAANLYGHPEKMLKLCAVTGTNGKTTTALLLEQMLKSVARKCVLIGTIETHVGDEVRVSPHTTPEASDTLRVFADGVAVGATEAVMEMSSHALEQERVWGFPVDVGIFTNLTQDHLDYHGTMERYFAAKARLFEGVGAVPSRVGVINADDPYGKRLVKIGLAMGCEVWRYGWEANDGLGEFRAENVDLRAGETRFVWRSPGGSVKMRSPLTGRVNVYNLLAASCAALARGLTLEEIAASTEKLKQVPGRFEVVPGSNEVGFTVVVDYAHTDDALRNLIALARELVKERGGRVITLFGCGGDRDRTKRPRMGRVAGEGSDLVVLTSDNPRSEEPSLIIKEALAGVRETGVDCVVEEDRFGAIEIAIRAARAGDIVLLAGKGHEKVQILKDRTVPFDDVAVAADVLKEML